jgi:hypothetical protein
MAILSTRVTSLSLRDRGLPDDHFPVIRRLSFRADPIISSPTSLGRLAGDGRDGGSLRAGRRDHIAEG